MNRWNINEWLETHVLERDKDCIYCRAIDPLSTQRPANNGPLRLQLSSNLDDIRERFGR
jgi:hypothetical protein